LFIQSIIYLIIVFYFSAKLVRGFSLVSVAVMVMYIRLSGQRKET